jgi:hypothetical protein
MKIKTRIQRDDKPTVIIRIVRTEDGTVTWQSKIARTGRIIGTGTCDTVEDALLESSKGMFEVPDS